MFEFSVLQALSQKTILALARRGNPVRLYLDLFLFLCQLYPIRFRRLSRLTPRAVHFYPLHLLSNTLPVHELFATTLPKSKIIA
jgi:hypothetical protein